MCVWDLFPTLSGKKTWTFETRAACGVNFWSDELALGETRIPPAVIFSNSGASWINGDTLLRVCLNESLKVHQPKSFQASATNMPVKYCIVRLLCLILLVRHVSSNLLFSLLRPVPCLICPLIPPCPSFPEDGRAVSGARGPGWLNHGAIG